MLGTNATSMNAAHYELALSTRPSFLPLPTLSKLLYKSPPKKMCSKCTSPGGQRMAGCGGGCGSGCGCDPNCTCGCKSVVKVSTNGTHRKMADMGPRFYQFTKWDEHVFWTREVIIGIVNKLPSLDASVEVLLQNQKDIAASFRKRYPQAVETIEKLLTEHIVQAKGIVESLDGPASETKRLLAEWNVNGRQIADALHSLNPSLSTQMEWRKHLQTHLDITAEEAVAYKQGRYVESQERFQEALREARIMAYAIAALVA